MTSFIRVEDIFEVFSGTLDSSFYGCQQNTAGCFEDFGCLNSTYCNKTFSMVAM